MELYRVAAAYVRSQNDPKARDLAEQLAVPEILTLARNRAEWQHDELALTGGRERQPPGSCPLAVRLWQRMRRGRRFLPGFSG